MYDVSIHAPVRERHVIHTGQVYPAVVSIHAPVRERHELQRVVLRAHGVSIHAPVRERHCAPPWPILAIRFNSRSREGATEAVELVNVDKGFQFTLP